MADIIVSILLLILVCLSIRTIITQRKKGTGCSGCPSGGSCTKQSCTSFNKETIEQIRKDIKE
ncbi:MAG: FeoB-associated Cys-rich membrane protein [Holdemanella sp.]|nr:FeoB-associated Cys-rich membrane protein [Holdemanella sp.]